MAAPQLNDNFGRLTSNHPSSSASVLVPLEEVRWLESALIGLEETQSFSFWIVSALVACVKENGFQAPDPALFSRMTSSLSLALVDLAKTAFAMSSFCTLTRRAHFLKHVTLAAIEGQKARLLGSFPFQSDVFDASTLPSVLSEYDGAAATTSHLEVSKAVSKG